jgi:hypothetical protein
VDQFVIVATLPVEHGITTVLAEYLFAPTKWCTRGNAWTLRVAR